MNYYAVEFMVNLDHYLSIMPTFLQVAQLGQPVLRQTAKPVTNILDPKVQSLIDDLIATVMDVDGVGIAAPQVYHSLRLFIVASHPNLRYPQAPEMESTPMINPILVSHNQVKVKDWEGCLSIPGIRALVPRFTEIEIKYINHSGKSIRTKYTDFIARIFQHELDHLDGTVFLDRVADSRDIITEKEYQRLVTGKSTKKIKTTS